MAAKAKAKAVCGLYQNKNEVVHVAQPINSLCLNLRQQAVHKG
jgi:hypothetical protein